MGQVDHHGVVAGGLLIAAQHEQATVVCLIPARTDARWWPRYFMKHEIRLLRGRLRFGEATASAPVPSAIVVMRARRFRLVGFEL